MARGYPESEDIEQHWGEWTGRLGVDWKPVLSFTDNTMLYAFYSRGYKGGGANPPASGFGEKSLFDFRPDLEVGIVNSLTNSGNAQYIPAVLARFNRPILHLTGVEYERTFEPEFVNAFEVGAKNTLLGGDDGERQRLLLRLQGPGLADPGPHRRQRELRCDGLTTNVFALDPRLMGLSILKDF